MPVSRLIIAELPGVGVKMEAGGDYTPGEGGLSEELMMKAVEAVNKALNEREDMSAPQVIGGDKEAIRKVYGDDAAEGISASKPIPEQKIEPGTILRFPSS